MSVTFTMDISNAKVTNMYGMNNIIKEVKFSLTGTDGVNTVTNFLPVKLDYPEAKDFIEYEELTRNQIFQWVINNVEENLISNLKTGITSQLRDKQIVDPDNPVLKKIKLPS